MKSIKLIQICCLSATNLGHNLMQACPLFSLAVFSGTFYFYFIFLILVRLYKTPTREKMLSFKRPETCPVYTKRCILWI